MAQGCPQGYPAVAIAQLALGVLTTWSLLLCAGCAHEVVRPDPELAAILARMGPEAPDEQDELRAYAPAEYLGQVAGHGVGGGLDLSAACGCADVSSAGGPSVMTPNVSVDIEHQGKAKVKVIVVVPEM